MDLSRIESEKNLSNINSNSWWFALPNNASSIHEHRESGNPLVSYSSRVVIRSDDGLTLSKQCYAYIQIHNSGDDGKT